MEIQTDTDRTDIRQVAAVTRRRLLKSAISTGAVLPLGIVLECQGAETHEGSCSGKVGQIVARISRTELERRWQLVRRHMKERDIDVLVSQGREDFLSGYVKWLTDFGSVGYLKVVLFHRDDLMTIIRHGAIGGRQKLDGGDPQNPGVGLELTTAAIPSVHYTLNYEAQLITRELKRRNVRRVGLIGPGGMPSAFLAHLKDELAGRAEFLDVTEFVDHCKAIKSVEEIAEIRQAALMQDAIFGKVLAEIRPGMRDGDVIAIAQDEARRLGGNRGLVMAGSAPVGRPAVYRFYHDSKRVIELGDCLTLNIEMDGLSGYFTELRRPIVFGKATGELLEAFDAIKAAHDHTANRFRPGNSCRDIAAAHDDYMVQHAMSTELRLYCHGQGYDLVERPLIRSDETMKLEENMNLTCHPSHLTERQYVALSDNFLVTAAGGERIHKTPQQVFEV